MKINIGTNLDLTRNVTVDVMTLVDTRMLIQGNSGAGKSWLMRLMAEREKDVQILVLDPEGEFGTLRQSRTDFLLVGGDDAEIKADTKSATLLARRLAELGTSAILDLYQLKLQERRHFVKLFLDSLLNLPKSTWHPILVFLDEAHLFCPERGAGESESTEAVIALMSQGRKRGICGIPATQRISKLHKDAVAECNNVVIGRTWLDIDQLRAGDILGLAKADRVQLRNLEQGTFFAFGPAFSIQGVFQFKSALVLTPHPKAGERHKMVIPAASTAIARIVAELKDLPTRAAEEAKTVQDLQAQIRTLKAQIRRPAPQPEVSAAMVAQYVKKENLRVNQAWLKGNSILFRSLKALSEKIKDVAALSNQINLTVSIPPAEVMPTERASFTDHGFPALKDIVTKPLAVQRARSEPVEHSGSLPGPEQRILDAAMWLHNIGIDEPDQRAVAFLAKYSPGGGAFNNPKGKLRGKGLIDYLPGGRLKVTDEGRKLAQPREAPLSTEELHETVLAQLGGPEQRILKPLLECHPKSMEVTELAEKANYEIGGAFNNPKGRLRTLGLIDYPQPGFCRAEDILFID